MLMWRLSSLRNRKLARRLRSVAVGLLAGLLVIFIYITFLLRTTEHPQVETAPPPVRAPAFDLIDQNGDRFTKADLQGKVWLADLTHAVCPDGCSTLTGNLALVRDRLLAEGLLGEHVVLVSFSAHPQVDTPEAMMQLATAYDADGKQWRFLTGAHRYLDEYVGANFFLPVDVLPHEKFGPGGPPPYAIVRSNRFVLVDRAGHVRNYYGGDRMHINRELELLLEEIRQLLLED